MTIGSESHSQRECEARPSRAAEAFILMHGATALSADASQARSFPGDAPPQPRTLAACTAYIISFGYHYLQQQVWQRGKLMALVTASHRRPVDQPLLDVARGCSQVLDDLSVYTALQPYQLHRDRCSVGRWSGMYFNTQMAGYQPTHGARHVPVHSDGRGVSIGHQTVASEGEAETWKSVPRSSH
jgi:hypothetical protein